MTNVPQIVTNAVPAANNGFFVQHSSEIAVAIITAFILGCGAILWQYIIHPRIVSWQDRRAGAERKEEIVTSLSDMTFSFGNRYDFPDKTFISVTLPNSTSRSIVIREVYFMPDGFGKFIAFHNPQDKLFQQATAKTRTGFDIPPHNQATWYLMPPKMTGNHPLRCTKCSVVFEYESAPGDLSTHVLQSPLKKEKEIEQYFEWIWKANNNK